MPQAKRRSRPFKNSPHPVQKLRVRKAIKAKTGGIFIVSKPINQGVAPVRPTPLLHGAPAAPPPIIEPRHPTPEEKKTTNRLRGIVNNNIRGCL